jgi:hypothetical protein
MRLGSLAARLVAAACTLVVTAVTRADAGTTAAGAPPPLPAEGPLACPPGNGRTYEIGEGKSYATVGAMPWEKLSAGDRVLIHWRREPYREKILISTRGTAEQPIRVCGVPGPDGALPVISGENATTRREAHYPYAATQERGLVILTLRHGSRWGFKPGYILIQGLELRSAWRGNDPTPTAFRTFLDNEGKQRPYSGNAAGIFVERGEHVTIRGNTITDCGYGLFVASGGSEEVLSREILVEGNYIHGNGYEGIDRRHNVYTEAAGITLQGNRFGPLRPGALGNQIKDRSAGTIVRFNWIEGGAHLLDLVEPEDATPMLMQDPRYHDTWVYGNVMICGPEAGSNLVHYGGDNGKVSTYRKGTLHFFHNTVIVSADERKRYNTTLFRVETPDETVDARNNVVWRTGTTHLNLMKAKGRLRLGVNWISSGWAEWQYLDKKDGDIEGLDAILGGEAPGFVDAAAGDYRLTAAAPGAARAAALPADLPRDHAMVAAYVPHQRVARRPPPVSLGALGVAR